MGGNSLGVVCCPGLWLALRSVNASGVPRYKLPGCTDRVGVKAVRTKNAVRMPIRKGRYACRKTVRDAKNANDGQRQKTKPGAGLPG